MFKKFDSKIFDLVILVGINLLAVIISLLTDAVFLVSTLLFLGIPSMYILARGKVNYRKVLLATLVFGTLYSFSFDFLAEYNKAWDWNGGLLFTEKILGVVQIDVLVWFFLWVLYFIVFYEHFIDGKDNKKLSKYTPHTIFIGAIVLALILIVFEIKPELLNIPYAYLSLCLAILFAFIIISAKKPKLLLKLLPILPFFFFVYITHELTSLHLEQWNFPGEYIGWVEIMSIAFPIEELIFWVGLSSLIGVSFYESAFDDMK